MRDAGLGRRVSLGTVKVTTTVVYSSAPSPLFSQQPRPRQTHQQQQSTQRRKGGGGHVSCTTTRTLIILCTGLVAIFTLPVFPSNLTTSSQTRSDEMTAVLPHTTHTTHTTTTDSLLSQNEITPVLQSKPTYRLQSCTDTTSMGGTAATNAMTQAPLPPWIQTYVDFQKEWIIMDSSTSNHSPSIYTWREGGKNLHQPKRPSLLVWNCPAQGTCGGLGDRLYGMIMGFYMAMLSHRLFVIQEWRATTRDSSTHPNNQDDTNIVPHPLYDYVQPHHFPWQMDSYHLNTFLQNHTSMELLSTVDNRNHPVLLDPCTLQTDRQDYFLRNNIMTYQEQMVQSSCFQTYWQTHGGAGGSSTASAAATTTSTIENDKVLHPDRDGSTVDTATIPSLSQLGFWTLFCFTPRVQDKARDLLIQSGVVLATTTSDLATSASPLLYIGMHVRTGQGETWTDPERHAGIGNLWQFHQCALDLQAALVDKCAAAAAAAALHDNSIQQNIDIYVAADNAQAKEFFLNAKRDASSHNHKTFKTVIDMEVFHIDRTNTEKLRDTREAYDNVWGELKVLIDATCLVMSRSKFSTLAMELSPQFPRCAVYFDQCSDELIQKAVKSVTHC